MKNSKLKNLELNKKQITKLTNLNKIWGGTGTIVDENTNPYDDTTNDVPTTNPIEEPPTHTNTNAPITTGRPIGGGNKKNTTSKLC